VAPEAAESGVLGLGEMLRREVLNRFSSRRALGSQSDEPGKLLESVVSEVGIPVEPEQLRAAVARPGDPVLGPIGSELGLQDAAAVRRDGFEEIVQSRIRAMSSSRLSTRCAVPASRTS
jgi:hypothetical protein